MSGTCIATTAPAQAALMITENITYRSITLGLPDAGITVLAALTEEASERTAMAYMDDSGWIECATGENITHLVTFLDLGACFLYRADAAAESERALVAPGQPWRPAIHMPRVASRITLEVTGLSVEQLQDISEADALAEGIVETCGGFGLPDGSHFHAADPRESYWSLWEAINGSGSVERNPPVWVVEFRKRQNVKAQATPTAQP